MTTNFKIIAGVDEAGRGCWAGDVFAASVILDPNNPISGLTDSKKLSETKREFLSNEIKEKALSFAIAFASVAEIDELNILKASLLAMQRAVNSLHITPDLVLIDGNQAPKISIATQTIVKGDATIQAISAASILAKVARDETMRKLDNLHPEYKFAQHKGYGTKLHLEMLKKHGVLPVHRASFKPIYNLLKERK